MLGTGELPLFPLSTVLFPGGRLDLRIFEQRYLGMVRDCLREKHPFGVCLILHGRDVGTPATPAAYGCTAEIVDFGSTPEGLLSITVRGVERFHVDRTKVRDNGLIVGAVTRCGLPPPTPVPAEFSLLSLLVERIAEQAGGELARADRASFDDAEWIAWRLAEFLPLALTERQQLLQMATATERLAQLTAWMPRFQQA
jgi:hypothetical protein